MVSLNRAGDMVNVFDFNRARVRRDVLAGAPDVNPNEKFRFPSDDEEQTAVCRQDTVIEGDEINPSFTSIVRTSLPFRARGIPVKLSPGEHWSVMRSQNSILLVTVSLLCFCIIRMLTFEAPACWKGIQSTLVVAG